LEKLLEEAKGSLEEKIRNGFPFKEHNFGS
jgi:hypothetical protein